MANLELWVASKESSLSVRSFSVREEMSGLFDVSILARSPHDDLDLDALVGFTAGFRIHHAIEAPVHRRLWTGVCSHAEQVEVEPSGLSTYFLRIVPELWRASQRRNCRIFQHKSAPEIVAEVLAEWDVVPEVRLDPKAFPRFEYRVQYAETDLAFVSRLLEEAGIAYFFEPYEDKDKQKRDYSRLVLADRPQRGELRFGSPVAFFATSPGGAAPPPDKEWVTSAKVAHQVRPGKFTIRDYDFRSRPDVQLLADAQAALAVESRYELFDYEPGAFLVEPRDDADPRARVDEKEAKLLAARRLDGARSGRRHVHFQTTSPDLSPGTVLSVGQHPRPELAPEHALLVVRRALEGTATGEWTFSGEAVFAEASYRPELRTPRPRVVGVQSALVVGPPDEEIHTDEFGRVRVQFHWDREGKHDAKSSCFIRVSQGWAGSGYGMVALPRVGQEVLVDFFEGDPDQPVIVGRVFNNAMRVPYKLPDQRTRSAWKSRSSPASGGSNELMFEDATGGELLYLHAERDLEQIVKNDERVTIGASGSRTVGKGEVVQIGEGRVTAVKTVDVLSVGETLLLQVGGKAGLAMHKDGKIVLSTGEASITLDGANILIDAKGDISVAGAGKVNVGGGKVHIDGSPDVHFNGGEAQSPAPLDFLGNLFRKLELGAEGEATKLEKQLAGSVTSAGDQLVSGLMKLPQEAVAAVMAVPNALLADAKKLPGELTAALDKAKKKALDALDKAETKALGEASKLEDKALGELDTLEKHALDRVTKAEDHLLDNLLGGGGGGGGVPKSHHVMPDKIPVPAHVNEQLKQGALAAAKKPGLNVAPMKSKAALDAQKAAAAKPPAAKGGEAAAHAKEVAAAPKGAPASEHEQALDSHASKKLDAAHAHGKAAAAAAHHRLASPGRGEEAHAKAELDGAKPPAATGAGPGAASGAGPHAANGGAAPAHAAAVAPSQLGSRAGGLSGADVSSTVHGSSRAAFLQSPHEGQLLVVHTAASTPVHPHELSSHMVDAQMSGGTAHHAMTHTLTDSGYAVYHRPAGDFSGPFVKAPAG